MSDYRNLIEYEKGLVNAGDDARILAVMKKAALKEPVTVAFLGGSITQGAVASVPENCYAARVYKWWREAFPETDITYVNAGIGGTTSHLGTGRVEEEVLRHRPDFIVVEFSVNDDDYSPHFKETYEGLVRRILKADFAPALLLVHNVRYDDGGNAEAIHHAVGSYYDLPCVSMKPTIYAQVGRGNIARRDITPDDLHPNDEGHALVAGVITRYLEAEKKKALGEADAQGEQDAGPKAAGSRENSALREPLTANGYEDAHRYRNDELQPVFCDGFAADESAQSCVADCFKKGWTADRIGAKIIFKVLGSCIGVQYRKTVRKPAPVATLTLDGDRERAVILDANFDQTWGDCLYLETILEHGKSVEHTVEIEITETHADDAECFYLVSIITAG